MAGAVWVLAEQWRGGLSEVTYELLALGRQLADGLGAPLEAVLLGSGAGGLAGSLGTADRVLYADAPELAEPIGEHSSVVLAALATERKPCRGAHPHHQCELGSARPAPGPTGGGAGELLW